MLMQINADGVCTQKVTTGQMTTAVAFNRTHAHKARFSVVFLKRWPLVVVRNCYKTPTSRVVSQAKTSLLISTLFQEI